MKNGPYTLIVAPSGYPGKKYRGRYAYEHIVEFWRKTGRLPRMGYVVHHRNDNKRDNAWTNLQEKGHRKHSGEHNERPIRHGSWSGYRRGCRCAKCRAANTRGNNEYRWRTGRRKKRVSVPE